MTLDELVAETPALRHALDEASGHQHIVRYDVAWVRVWAYDEHENPTRLWLMSRGAAAVQARVVINPDRAYAVRGWPSLTSPPTDSSKTLSSNATGS